MTPLPADVMQFEDERAFVDRVYASNTVDHSSRTREALGAAANISAMGGPSVTLAKECVNRACEGCLAGSLSYERPVFHSLVATEDQKEGMDAFVARRKPGFTHR